MKLSQLLSALGLSCPQEVEITAVTCNSQEVIPGALFVAIPGARTDGHRYIPQAEARGAAALVCRRPVESSLPTFILPDPRLALALLAAAFYRYPHRELTTVALTGTKGKTTTAHMIRDILLRSGRKAGMIGTLGAFSGTKQLAETQNTTPEPVALHRLLRDMADDGCTHVVLEVSSQAMKLQRVAGIQFDAGVFLNLSPDHIGGAEHRDFEEYRACKGALFRQCSLVLGNHDDPAWPYMAGQLPPGRGVLTFGFGRGADIRGGGLTPDSTHHPLGGSFTVTGGSAPYHLAMPGAFNAADALAAVALCRTLAIDDASIRAGLANISVPGRTQVYPHTGDCIVLLDYAHNGESFRALLSTLREYEHRRILLVFGAGGDRPRLRRRDMARAAAELADFAVITADNPRSEPVEDICQDIALALDGQLPYEIVPCRRQAIFRALDLAEPGDIVALLGKGHEQYIEEQGVRQPFSELQVLEEYFA